MSIPDSASAAAWREQGSRVLDVISSVDLFAAVDANDPWSTTSLNAIESQLLKTWTSAADVPPEVTTLCGLFLGEGLRRRYDGEWVTLDPALIGETAEGAPHGVGVSYKSGAIDVVSSLIPQAFRTSTGTWWSASFEATGQLATA